MTTASQARLVLEREGIAGRMTESGVRVRSVGIAATRTTSSSTTTNTGRRSAIVATGIEVVTITTILADEEKGIGSVIVTQTRMEPPPSEIERKGKTGRKIDHLVKGQGARTVPERALKEERVV